MPPRPVPEAEYYLQFTTDAALPTKMLSGVIALTNGEELVDPRLWQFDGEVDAAPAPGDSIIFMRISRKQAGFHENTRLILPTMESWLERLLFGVGSFGCLCQLYREQ